MSCPSFDLQCHSLHSDGELPPADVMAVAARFGVRVTALTDHDTVEGVDEARKAGARQGMTVVPAVELSAVFDGYEDLHVLGYLIDHRDAVLVERLAYYREDRRRRGEAMARRLEQLGFAVDFGSLGRRRRAGRPIGRPHVAAALLDVPENQPRLLDEGILDAPSLIARYLIPGARAYVPRKTPTVAEAISAIHDAGGLAVWAHPFWDISSADAVLGAVEKFLGTGLDGVEAFYITHTREQTHLLADWCGERELIMTGSADFHGPNHPRFNRFRNFEVYGRTPALGRIAD
jgi:3',5'-nucleoside bisphosphate phosphatase